LATTSTLKPASREWSAYFSPVIAFAFMPSCGNVHSAFS
jgi:hypothetical protein